MFKESRIYLSIQGSPHESVFVLTISGQAKFALASVQRLYHVFSKSPHLKLMILSTTGNENLVSGNAGDKKKLQPGSCNFLFIYLF